MLQISWWHHSGRTTYIIPKTWMFQAFCRTLPLTKQTTIWYDQPAVWRNHVGSQIRGRCWHPQFANKFATSQLYINQFRQFSNMLCCKITPCLLLFHIWFLLRCASPLSPNKLWWISALPLLVICRLCTGSTSTINLLVLQNNLQILKCFGTILVI